MEEVEVRYSHGNGANNKRWVFIRPSGECFNRSRRVGGFTNDEIMNVVNKCIEKWFTPLKYFQIEDYIIGSNSEENAVKEYWRVCDKKDIGTVPNRIVVVKRCDTTEDDSSNKAG